MIEFGGELQTSFFCEEIQLPQLTPEPPQFKSKPTPKQHQINPKSFRKASWRPSWAHAPGQIDFGGSQVPTWCQNGAQNGTKI